MITIHLQFNNYPRAIFGEAFGKTEFERQVKSVSYDADYTLIFPKEIKTVTTSFVRGFFAEFVRTWGIVGLDQHLNIISSIKNFKQFVIDCVD